MTSTGKKLGNKTHRSATFRAILLFFAILLFSGSFFPFCLSSLDAEVVELIQFDDKDNENEKEKEKEKEEVKSKYFDFYNHDTGNNICLDTPAYHSTKVSFWQIPLQDIITPPPERA